MFRADLSVVATHITTVYGRKPAALTRSIGSEPRKYFTLLVVALSSSLGLGPYQPIVSPITLYTVFTRLDLAGLRGFLAITRGKAHQSRIAQYREIPTCDRLHQSSTLCSAFVKIGWQSGGPRRYTVIHGATASVA